MGVAARFRAVFLGGVGESEGMGKSGFAGVAGEAVRSSTAGFGGSATDSGGGAAGTGLAAGALGTVLSGLKAASTAWGLTVGLETDPVKGLVAGSAGFETGVSFIGAAGVLPDASAGTGDAAFLAGKAGRGREVGTADGLGAGTGLGATRGAAAATAGVFTLAAEATSVFAAGTTAGFATAGWGAEANTVRAAGRTEAEGDRSGGDGFTGAGRDAGRAEAV